MGKVSDAIEKSQSQAAIPGERSLTDVEASRTGDNKRPVAINSLDTATIKNAQSENRDEPDNERQVVSSLPKQNRPKPIANREKDHRYVIDQSKIDENLIVHTSPHSYEAEQFRMLRTNVLFPKSGTPARSILIASTMPSEGKSFVASNLAISIAQNVDKYVLLIDCDIRKPSIHELFGFGPIDGLSDYLTRGLPLSSLIQNTFIKRLSILPGGPPPVNPSELLSSTRMADLLKEVSQRYNDRFIIIDSPPVLMTSESKALAEFAHGVLLVTRFDKTDKRMALEVIKKIGKEKIVGVVGNFVDRKFIKKSYGSKYTEYYGGYSKLRQ